MKVFVNEDTCIGCGLCADTCPDIFEVIEDKAVVKISEVPENYEELVKEAKDNCPVDAISIEE
ncbi:MAG: ferredoxin [Proteobacteria bacterium]|nr:ferredoxin [Pseudomonadota bacterium]